MIPDKHSETYKEYMELHYKMQRYYRKYSKYAPFRYIEQKIKRKWQLICYAKNNNKMYGHNKPFISTIRWGDNEYY